MKSMTIIGNLVNDPETRIVNTAHGPTPVTNFRMGCKGRNKKESSYVRVTAWGNAGKTIEKYAKAKSRMMVRGEPSFSVYTDRNGQAAGSLELTVEDFEFLSGQNEFTAESIPVARAEAPAPIYNNMATRSTEYDCYDSTTECDKDTGFAVIDEDEDDGLPF